MPSHPVSEAGPRHILIAAGTEHFRKLDDCDLPDVPGEVTRIVSTFRTLGYDSLPVKLDPDHDELEMLFASAKDDFHAGDIVVAYYTGHGAKDEVEGRYYLLTCDSVLRKLERTALAAEDLARALIKQSKAAQILIVLDCCYAGAGAAEVAQIAGGLASLGGTGPDVFVIAAARTKQEAEPGALSSALEKVLITEDERLGGRVQAFLVMEEVMEAINGYLRENHPAQIARWHANAEGRCRVFPNSRFRAGIQPGIDLETQRAYVEHWVPKARGVEFGAGGWYFTGRVQALRELAAWLSGPRSECRVRVVTGGPGCGKSAVLARVVTLANSTYRREVLSATGTISADPTTLPPEGVVNVAVVARHKLLAEVVEQIARSLGLGVRDPAELVSTLRRRSNKTVIVLDALDESNEAKQIVSRLLRPLARLPHVFLLVATRPDSSKPGQKFRALGTSTVEIDLDDPRYIGRDDVACYVERRLLATEEPRRSTHYRGAPALARTVAQAVSDRSKNVFIVAHTATIALLAKPIVDVSVAGWIDSIPTGLDSAFSQFLEELDRGTPAGASSSLARAVLLPLAFAEGEGLPWVAIWAELASALSGSRVSDNDIALVRRHAAAFIVEALENGGSVYRLYHERVAEYLRDSIEAEKLAQRRIVEALRSRVPAALGTAEPDWTRAHPYVLTHLISHALKGAMLDELLADGLFVAEAEPLHMLQVLSKCSDPFARRSYNTYELALHNLRDKRSEDRLSYLEMAARQLGDDSLADLWTRRSQSRRWSVPWAHWSISPHRVIPLPIPAATPIRNIPIALSTVAGRPVIVVGAEDGTVRMWDLASGTPRGEPMCGHDGPMYGIAVGSLEGRPVAVSAGHDATVCAWDLTSGKMLGSPLRDFDGWVTSVAVGTLEDRPVIVAGGEDGWVRVWDLASGKERFGPSQTEWFGPSFSDTRLETEVYCVAVGWVKGQPVIAAAGEEGSLGVWDLASGDSLAQVSFGEGDIRSLAVGSRDDKLAIVFAEEEAAFVWDVGADAAEPLKGGASGILCATVGSIEHRSVIVIGAWDGIHVWDLASGEPLKPLRGHSREVVSVAVGTFDDQSVVVSSGNDGTLRVWDLSSETLQGESRRSHGHGAASIAVGDLDGRTVVVSGANDGALRVWDAVSGAARGDPIRGHDGVVHAVAVGLVEGRQVIVSGGEDGTVRVWDMTSGAPQGEPLRGHKGGVYSVAVETVEGQSVIVSSDGWDGTVRTWALASGALLSESGRSDVGGVDSSEVCTRDGESVSVSFEERYQTIRLRDSQGSDYAVIHIGSEVSDCVAVPGGILIVATRAGLMALQLF